MSLKIDKGVSDVLKLIAACLVCLHHYFQYRFSFIHDFSNELWGLFLLNQQLGYSSVAIFFFLSGYGLMESHQHKQLNFIAFIRKRLIKIYLPFLCVNTIWLSFIWVTKDGNFSIIDFLYGIIWQGHDNVLWFIKVLILLYVIFYLYTISLINWSRKYSLCFLCISTMLISLIAYKVIGYYSYISIPLFSIGILCSLYKNSIFTKRNPLWLILVVYLSLSFLIAITFQNLVFAFHILANYIIIILIIYTSAKYVICFKT